MNLVRIVITSDTFETASPLVNRLTGEKVFTPSTRPHHRFFITRHFDDGTKNTVYTNRYGEGLFTTRKDGSEYQITGTCQYSVNDNTAADAKRWFRGKLRKELAESGAKLEFDLDY